MNTERRRHRQDPLRAAERTLEHAVIVAVCVLGLLLCLIFASSAQAQVHVGEWPQSDRLGSEGACHFHGVIAPDAAVEVTCFTGQAIRPPAPAQIETGSIDLAGALVASQPGAVVAVIRNTSQREVAAHVVARVFSAAFAPPHPCALPPPPQPWTLRDRCIQDACAAGAEPVCMVKTEAPGTGMPGAN